MKNTIYILSYKSLSLIRGGKDTKYPTEALHKEKSKCNLPNKKYHVSTKEILVPCSYMRQHASLSISASVRFVRGGVVLEKYGDL